MRGDPLLIKATDIVIDLHNRIINQTGGELGIRDEAGIYFSLKNIDDAGRAKEPITLIAARVYHEFAQKHHFIDGNKRTAHLLAKLLLLDQQHYFMVRYRWAVPYIIAIADRKKTIEHTERWIRDHTHKFHKSNKKRYLNKWKNEYVKVEKRGRPPKYAKEDIN